MNRVIDIALTMLVAFLGVAATVPQEDAQSNISTWLPEGLSDVWPVLKGQSADNWAYVIAAVACCLIVLRYLKKKGHGMKLDNVHTVGLNGFILDQVDNASITNCSASGPGNPGSRGFKITNSHDVDLEGAVSRGHEVGFEIDKSPRANLKDAVAEASQSGKLFNIPLPDGMKQKK